MQHLDGRVLAGLLFLSTLALADDLGGVSLTSGYNRFSGPTYWGPPFCGYYRS